MGHPAHKRRIADEGVRVHVDELGRHVRRYVWQQIEWEQDRDGFVFPREHWRFPIPSVLYNADTVHADEIRDARVIRRPHGSQGEHQLGHGHRDLGFGALISET